MSGRRCTFGAPLRDVAGAAFSCAALLLLFLALYLYWVRL